MGEHVNGTGFCPYGARERGTPGARTTNRKHVLATKTIPVSLLLLLWALGALPAFAIECATPREWRPRLTGTPLDVDGNFIADSLDGLPPGAAANVILDLNRCPEDEDVARLGQFGTVGLVGEYTSVVALRDVDGADLAALSRDEIVAFVEEDLEFHPTLVVSRPTVRADLVTSVYGYDGAGVTLAVMDTGVDDGVHDALPGSTFVGGLDCATAGPCAVVNADDLVVTSYPFSGHGTLVASIALGRGGGECPACVGIAPGAGLVDIRVGKPGFIPSTWTLVMALETMLKMNRKLGWGVDVLNMSIGSCSPSNGTDAVSKSVNRVVFEGIVVVISMGNTSNCGLPPNASLVASPAAADDGIAVGNSNDLDTTSRADDVLAITSLTGPRTADGDLDTADERKPDLAAPGSLIQGARADTPTQYRIESGTSLSAPHVAGCAALILQANPTMLPLSVKQLLIQTAEEKPPPGWDAFWGNGLADCFEAIRTIVESEGTDLRFEVYDCKPSPPPCWTTSELYTVTPPFEGQPNTIVAEITNAGPIAASNFLVSLGVSDFGNGQAAQHVCTQQVTTVVPSGGKATVSCPYTPNAGPGPAVVEANLRAEIIYPGDTDFTNNRAVHKVSIQKPIITPVPVPWNVVNLTTETQIIQITPEEACCEGFADAGPACACPGWQIRLSDNDIPMAPDDCPKLVTALVEPVDMDALRAAEYHIQVAGAGGAGAPTDLGGVTVKATLACRVTGLEWTDTQRFRWQGSPFTACPIVFDTARGPLPIVDGDFSPAACLVDDGSDLVTSDPETPAAGGFYYLVRAGGLDPGTWNTGDPQVGDRDASLVACP
jgi:subtilisin family serine protease